MSEKLVVEIKYCKERRAIAEMRKEQPGILSFFIL